MSVRTRSAARWALPAAFAGLFAAQLLPAAWLASERMERLAAGRPVVLAVETRDPRDLLRGEYSTLAYEVGRLQGVAAAPPPGCDLAARGGCPLAAGRPVYVRLVADAAGVHRAAGVSFERPPGGDPFLAGTLRAGTLAPRGATVAGRDAEGRPEPATCGHDACLTGQAAYGIETWYGPQGVPAKLDRAARRDVRVEARVAADGAAAIEAITVGGRPFARTARLW